MLSNEVFFSREKAAIYATMTGGFWEGPYMDDKGRINYLVWFREENRKPIVEESCRY